MQNIILHLDMNSYFASVEQQDHPEWRGLPVGVCEHLGGILIAASVQAKKWGIKTGTPVWEARKLYPKIIVTPTSPDRYRHYHKLMVRVAGDYTDKVERYSIDEVFLDITKFCNISVVKDGREYCKKDPWEEAVNIAREIKRRMKNEVGDYLTCSVGIAENKLLAKIASDLKKPDGLAVVRNLKPEDQNSKQNLNSESEILNLARDDLYRILNLTDVPGIGRRQEKNLNSLGIKTLSDLKNYPESRLAARFGAIGGHHLHNMGQLEGSWKSAVREDEDIKSLGHMYTLPREYRREEYFTPVLYKLSEMVGRRLRRQNLMGNVLHFYLSGGRGESWGKSRRLGYYAYDGRDIFLEASELYKAFRPEGGLGQIRLIGVSLSGLAPCSRQQSLFGSEEKHRRVVESLDRINEKYGDFTVCRVPLLAAGKVFKDSIGFGRLKEMPGMYGAGQ